MRVLLTGAQGNLGRRLSQRLKEKVVALGREDWDSFSSGKLGKIDGVIHCASDLRTPLSLSPTRVMDSNLMSTARLLELIREHSIPRLMFISSCAVYGKSTQTSEDSPCAPVTINGVTKLLGEKIIEDFCKNNKIQFEIYRVFNTYGGEDHFSIFHWLTRAMQEKRKFVLNNQGRSQRDFIHVDDVANLLVHFLASPPPFTHLNLGTGETVRVREIVEKFKKKFQGPEIEHREVEEPEYSRANINRLNSLITYQFRELDLYFQEK